MPTFASATSAGSCSKASWAMNSDTVKPMPAVAARPRTCRRPTPSGSTPQPASVSTVSRIQPPSAAITVFIALTRASSPLSFAVWSSAICGDSSDVSIDSIEVLSPFISWIVYARSACGEAAAGAQASATTAAEQIVRDMDIASSSFESPTNGAQPATGASRRSRFRATGSSWTVSRSPSPARCRSTACAK